MKINVNLNLEDEEKKRERVNRAKAKKEKYIPKWDEVWSTGYRTHTGTLKKGIFQTKLTDLERDRLLDVQMAVECGEIGIGVEDLSKFTKSHALKLYQVLKEQRREGIIKKMVEEKPDNYHCIVDKDDINGLCNLLNDEKKIAVDTETTGVDIWGNDYIVGVSLTLPKADKHFYIPMRHNFDLLEVKQADPVYTFKKLKPYLENKGLKKVLHNAKFDAHMLRKEGIDLKGLYMDTMVAMHLLNENEPSFALKNLATKYGEYFGFEDKSCTYEELFGKGGFENTPLDIGTVYACKDTHLTYEFSKWIESYFDKMPEIKKLYFEVERPITEVCIEMEKNGFAIDLKFAEEYKIKLQKQIDALMDRIVEGFGDININSNQQLAEVIYNQWGVSEYTQKLGIKGTTIKEHFVFGSKGENILVPEKTTYPVDAPTLKKIVSVKADVPEVAYIEDLLEYRGLNKLLTTYIEPLPQKVCERDGRLHGSFNQSATATGRFASNNPNLQNLPYDARQMIVAPKGKVIIGIDYSQIEPRVLSHMASDDKLKEPYITGKDLYSSLASTVFKQPLEECGDGSKWRKLAKVVLLATMYGTSSYTLSQQVGITQDEAEQIIEDFYASYLDVADFINTKHDEADELGYVKTMFGRKRRFIGHQQVAKKFKNIEAKVKAKVKKDKFNIWAEKGVDRELKKLYWETSKEYMRVNRQSVNAVIQGSSADIMKMAMVELEEHLRTLGDEFRMLATIHDEVLIEIPEDTPDDVILKIAEIQRDAVKLSIPFKVDIEVSKRWGKGVPFAEWREDRGII